MFVMIAAFNQAVGMENQIGWRILFRRFILKTENAENPHIQNIISDRMQLSIQ
jgi:hypothetical protein